MCTGENEAFALLDEITSNRFQLPIEWLNPKGLHEWYMCMPL